MIPPRARARLGLAMGALVLAASAGCQGCHREIRFSPGGTDSTFVPADSLRGLFRNVLDLWEAPDGGEEAAKLSALVVRVDLESHAGEPWATRARRLLDSLDVGAEVTADARVMAINFFAVAMSFQWTAQWRAVPPSPCGTFTSTRWASSATSAF